MHANVFVPLMFIEQEPHIPVHRKNIIFHLTIIMSHNRNVKIIYKLKFDNPEYYTVLNLISSICCTFTSTNEWTC